MRENMRYFTIQAKDNTEAMDRMKMQYGPGARVLTHRHIKTGGVLGFFQQNGVEITGYISPAEQAKEKMDLAEEKKKIIASAQIQKDKSFELILKELQDLKSGLKVNKNLQDDNGHHPAVVRIKDLLKQNDFSDDFIQEMIAKAKNNFSLEDLEKFHLVQKSLLEWIGERIKTYSMKSFFTKRKKIIVVIGPTGVGKTTTIAKLAAVYSLGSKDIPEQRVRMITIDNYKIAAKKQLETYAEIMQIPVSFPETKEDLEKIVNLYQEENTILIDTIGKSPNDYSKLAEMRHILSACGHETEIHLAISATTKSSDIEEILHQFEPYKYKAVILTKLDETSRIGNLISILAKHNKAASYLTDGQMVPQDIQPASKTRLLMGLEGFHIDREWIERKFGEKDVDI